MSSTCFEPEGSSSGRRLYMHLCYGMHGSKNKIRCFPTGEVKFTDIRRSIKGKLYNLIQRYGLTKHAT